jgi:MFS family permease
MRNLADSAYAWFVLLSFSALFFLVTAATFTSLGVVLPDMVSELGWSWTAAGFGFTVLGVSTGLSSAFPAFVIRKLGVRVTILVGTALLTTAFLILFQVQSVLMYFIAAAMAGTGHSFVSTLPGTYMIARNFKRQSTAFGIYFTIGGLGGIVGPLIYFTAVGVWDEWRMHWMLVAIGTALLGVLTAIFLREGAGEDQRAEEVAAEAMLDSTDDVYVTKQTWTVRQALRTPQFYLIVASYVCFLFCGITVNSLSVAHLTELGVAMGIAAGLLSFEAFLNAVSRAVSGFIGEYIDPKHLLVAGLAMLVAGMVALGAGSSWPLLIIYAFGIGAGYGVTFLASCVLLMNYYGRSSYLELFSIMNFFAALASTGPFLGGYMRDTLGSFSLVYLLYALVPALVMAGVFFMRPPTRAGIEEDEEDEAEPSTFSDEGLTASTAAQ